MCSVSLAEALDRGQYLVGGLWSIRRARRAIGRLDDVPDIEQPDPRHAIEGSDELSIGQLSLGVLDLRLIVRDRRLLLSHDRPIPRPRRLGLRDDEGPADPRMGGRHRHRPAWAYQGLRVPPSPSP